MPPRYTELYEPVGVDYILFTYLSCTRLHDVLLRCVHLLRRHTALLCCLLALRLLLSACARWLLGRRFILVLMIRWVLWRCLPVGLLPPFAAW